MEVAVQHILLGGLTHVYYTAVVVIVSLTNQVGPSSVKIIINLRDKR